MGRKDLGKAKRGVFSWKSLWSASVALSSSWGHRIWYPFFLSYVVIYLLWSESPKLLVQWAACSWIYPVRQQNDLQRKGGREGEKDKIERQNVRAMFAFSWFVFFLLLLLSFPSLCLLAGIYTSHASRLCMVLPCFMSFLYCIFWSKWYQSEIIKFLTCLTVG